LLPKPLQGSIKTGVTLQRLIALLAVALWLISPAASRAQQSTATMFGNVVDATGAAIPGATVVLTQTATNFKRETRTNSLGEYRAEFLPVGPYTVSIEAVGFKKTIQSGITLNGTQEAAVNYTLATGEATSVVNVTAEIPLVNEGNSVLGRTVDNREIDNLPLVNRDTYQLLSLTPGVQSVTNENSIGLPMEHVIINGSSDNLVGQVSYYLDGGMNMTGVRDTGNVIPNPDAIDQFTVDTNNFSAEYGRTGAGVVSVLTKSGTNTVHGSVFYFNQETNFDSTGYLQTSRTPQHKDQFGAAMAACARSSRITSTRSCRMPCSASATSARTCPRPRPSPAWARVPPRSTQRTKPTPTMAASSSSAIPSRTSP
jgi:hypothetical protein